MYGLMLPSGNDAAHALASHIGQILIEKQGEEAKTNQVAESLVIDEGIAEVYGQEETVDSSRT